MRAAHRCAWISGLAAAWEIGGQWLHRVVIVVDRLVAGNFGRQHLRSEWLEFASRAGETALDLLSNVVNAGQHTARRILHQLPPHFLLRHVQGLA